jgi:hypothetical protein
MFENVKKKKMFKKYIEIEFGVPSTALCIPPVRKLGHFRQAGKLQKDVDATIPHCLSVQF